MAPFVADYYDSGCMTCSGLHEQQKAGCNDCVERMAIAESPLFGFRFCGPGGKLERLCEILKAITVGLLLQC
jgi:hypothetical protein